jgi:predicted nucleic acid-binding protein
LILVDTSVLLDFLKGHSNSKTEIFETAIKQKLLFGIASYTYQEILQGAKNKQEYDKLKNYLSTQKIYFLPETIETYEKAAHLYFDLRRKGVTPRSTIDILILLTAIEHNLLLLHNDKDFDIISEKLTDLKICRKLASLP